MSEIYKELLQLNNKICSPFFLMRKTWSRYFTKEDKDECQ